MNEIEFRNIYKEYCLKKRTTHFLKDFFHPQYERKMALNGVSFSIPQGQIVGYIGPNGAGKSTTIKVMTGILKPTSGTCRVLGADPTQNHSQFVRQIGVVFGNRSNLIWDLPVIDSFKMMKEIYEIEDDRFNAQLELLTQSIGIQDILDVPVRQMSLGAVNSLLRYSTRPKFYSLTNQPSALMPFRKLQCTVLLKKSTLNRN